MTADRLPETALAAARQYVRAGFHVVPIPHRAKRATEDGWQNLRLTEADLPRHFNGRPQNIGLLLGIGGLTDVDLDSPEAVRAARFYLPATRMVYGRASRPASHWFYIADPPLRSCTFKDPVKRDTEDSKDRSTLVEIRGLKKDGGVGYCTVAPPSTHPEGEEIRFEDGCGPAPARVDAAILSRAAELIAAAALLARHWPPAGGGRHRCMLALAGALRRAGWTEEAAKRFCAAVYHSLADPDPAAMRRSDSEVESTFRRGADEEYTGLPTLTEILGRDVVRRACEWLRIDTAAGAAVETVPAAGEAGAVSVEVCTEDKLALKLVDQHGDRLRYVQTWGRWLVWDGKRWLDDQTRYMINLARQVCREAAGDDAKLRLRLERASTIEAVERLARSDRRVAVDHKVWDADPMALNTPDGILDFCTGEMRPHAPEAYCRKITGCGIGDGDAPRWREFLKRVTNGDEELERYLQRLAGYALTGSTSEHAFALLFGHGANGKSVFLNTLRAAWGDYATVAPPEVFLAGKGDRHPTELADLDGARLIIASEIDPGRRWNEARLKQFTGGENAKARYMRQDFYEFTPRGKVLIATNHKPRLQSVGEAMRRRLHLVPFTVTIPPEERDPLLADKLREELPAILAWCVEGTAEWMLQGLRPPACVLAQTEEYFETHDLLGEWLATRCELETGCSTQGSEALRDYRQWLEDRGEGSITRTAFYEALDARGIRSEIRRNVVWLLGLRLLPAAEGGQV